MKPARFTINSTQQKLLAAYLLVAIVWLLWRIEIRLQRMENGQPLQEANEQRRERERLTGEAADPVGVPDRDDQDPIDEVLDDLEEDPDS